MQVLGGLFTPGDGHIDPYSLTMALSIAAKRYGAEFYQHSPVSATNQKSDGTWEVVTPEGTITANRVINTAGRFNYVKVHLY